MGDLAEAQALYVPARTAYQHIAPAAQRLAELNNAIEARADYYEKREQDPGFTGFHRLEYGLWHNEAMDSLGAVVNQLDDHVREPGVGPGSSSRPGEDTACALRGSSSKSSCKASA